MEIGINSSYERTHIPAGTYQATLTGIRAGKIKGKAFADGNMPAVDANGMQDVLWWTFKTGDITIDGMTTMATGEKAKFRRWALALGCALPSSGSFNTEIMYGKPCLITVADKHKPGETPESKIADVFPPMGTAPAPGAASAEVI